MRKFFTASGVALLAIALLLNGAPANAGSISWNDPEGDAIGFLGVDPPRPSEPAYDNLKVDMTSDGKVLKVAAQFKQLGTIPPQSTGNRYGFSFTAGDGRFTLNVIQDHIGGEFSTFAVLDTTTNVNTATDCFKCTGKLNLESNTVELQIPVASLESARKSAGVGGKIGPGAPIQDVVMAAGEYYNLGYHIPGVTDALTGLVSINNTADSSPLPGGGKFTL